MALKHDIVYKGIPIGCAYLTVCRPSVDADKERMEFGLCSQVNPETETLDTISYNCPYVIDGGDIFEQAYLFLRTLPEYSGAEDC